AARAPAGVAGARRAQSRLLLPRFEGIPALPRGSVGHACRRAAGGGVRLHAHARRERTRAGRAGARREQGAGSRAAMTSAFDDDGFSVVTALLPGTELA